eukprot:CAMPEP_0115856996 /NCGR_PEP_ID=MMETSP0287-20121206/15344_1 /TAXON_ID=412157 /ORGANISM="Chrysochromulina rotalis, Strain UIO044" /LENGTH=380 /DNA_ID=CAMNT_0003311195 /DNA_START=8 /DNA_END=1150 /DNA_ORIENTATION=-
MPKKQPIPAMDSDDEDEQSVIGAARARDAEDDVFDVAHNSMLRTAAELPMTGRRLAVASADWDCGSTPAIEHKGFLASPSQPSGESQEPGKFAMSVTSSDDRELQAAEMQAAVEATWAKANALQDQAIAGATRAAIAEARKAFEVEKADTIKRVEEELRLEAEKANERLWRVAAKEREAAVKAALADQAVQLELLKKKLAAQKQSAADELEEAYKSLKAEVSRVVEDQHAANVNLAVQAAWERAGRIQETAVANARKEARAEAQAEADERMKLERLQLGTDMRESIQTSVQANEDELKSAKAEVNDLRQQLIKATAAARDAESNAAELSRQSVRDAMKAMESVQQASIDRAVARALATAKASGNAGAAEAPSGADVVQAS